ncbi:hypothetical protein JGS22_001740 [Streptomyces sp. P38-E01]|uniref:DNA helicase n=1 Tax=Streptomyces tardus TaxID=2780544 RepID=A0A949JAB1_9ACTN|nr:DEAD/DEAH box helicase [Streptomyces tardus]MBU7596393.1 hypothetical protein [Streptomyces tardus]
MSRTDRAERKRRADILRYWRAVELFGPQKVDRVQPQQHRYRVDAGEPLPWEEGHRFNRVRRPAGKRRQHTVYCGVYAVERVRDILLEVFDADEEEHDARLDGDSALLAFEVNDEGRLIEDSLVFSSCAWATGRALSPGPAEPGWLDGFEQDAQDCEDVIRQVGDGRLRIADTTADRLRPFAGIACEIVLGAATGGIGPAAQALLGEVAGGAVSGAADAAADAANEAVRARLDSTPGGTGGDGSGTGTDGDGGELDEAAAPQLGDQPLTVRELSALTRWVANRFHVSEALLPDAVRVHSRFVPERDSGTAVGSLFLNSFIASDLDLVAARIEREDPPAALRAYLAAADGIPVHSRVDVRERTAAVYEGVQPARFPGGRWPARTEHPLVLSQQFAVNTILEQLGDGEGLYAVNGPPGTGKTTQLRDLIAAVLVRRAEQLAALPRPVDAFTGTARRWKNEGYERSVLALRPELTGHEIVIASANNGAVENISVELPALGAVAEEWRSEADFFAAQGSLLLRGEPAWGTLAAKLGNKGNRSAFRSDYWFGPTAGGRRPAGRQDGDAPPAPGMREVLVDAAKRPYSPQDWRRAVGRFKEASDTVRRLRDERQRVARALAELAPALRAAEAAAAGVPPVEAQVRRARAELDAAEAASATRAAELDRARDRVAEHGRRRPGWWARTLRLGSARRWDEERGNLVRAERSAQAQHEEHTRTATDVRRAHESARARLARAQNALRAAADTAEAHQRVLDEARSRHPESLPLPEAAAAQDTREVSERRELSSPWSDPEFTAARTRLFLAATALHRAFLEGAADRMRKNLDAAMEVLSGNAPPTLPAAAVLAAWQNLFLAVPVVSTTFASLDRMFGGLGAGDIGWMLVDEAGQATPQMPVGALWRARRAVLVGDPLQLEPVVTLPRSGQQALRRSFGVDEEWTPGRNSAQRVADRSNTWGTWLPSPDDSAERVWVGSPLRVHRRCESPMFDISNRIAYEDLMVQGTPDRGSYPVAGRSVWWDVAHHGEGKWSAAEGEAANVIVHRLLDRGLDPAELFVIAPFRDVARGLSRRLCAAVDRARIGTVHTTQGKEADVVLLVLGSGGAAGRGARGWAAGTPNLLNVAASRARRRLFVVGDHGAWSRQRYFDVLADGLHLLTPAEQAEMRELSPPGVAGTACRCERG